MLIRTFKIISRTNMTILTIRKIHFNLKTFFFNEGRLDAHGDSILLLMTIQNNLNRNTFYFIIAFDFTRPEIKMLINILKVSKFYFFTILFQQYQTDQSQMKSMRIGPKHFR